MPLKVVNLPDIGEGVAEAEIVEWHVAVGDDVAEDQILVAVMTDKATVEIPSPVAGTITDLGAEVGSVLAVGSRLVGIEVENAARPKAGKQVAAATEAKMEPPIARPLEVREKSPSPESGDAGKSGGVVSPLREPRREPEPPRQQRTHKPGERPLASPAVRGRALQLGVDLAEVSGSGPEGRISHEDLDAFLTGATAAAPRATSEHLEWTEQIKITGLRRRIAEKMAQSTRRVAHFSYVEELDVTALEELRAHLNAQFGANRPKLTVLPFIARALVVALRDFPQMNALYDDEQEIVTRHGGVQLGIATQTQSGLMVPVVVHAEARDLWDIAAEIRRLAEAARDGSAAREELSGSTITITSLGELGGIASTPVINRPEVAIIGVNRMAIRPVWQNNQFVPRKMMNLSSSFDHRVIDGHDAASFIQRIKRLIELPATLFMDS